MASAIAGSFIVVDYLLINSNIEWRRIIKSLDLMHLPDEGLLAQPSQQVSKEKKNEIFRTSSNGFVYCS